MSRKRLIRPEELKPKEIRRAKAIIRKSLEHASTGITLAQYGLVTAEIWYFITYGSQNGLVRAQSFTWQELDVLPTCPVLHGFLSFWRRELKDNLQTQGRRRAPFRISPTSA